MSDTRNSQSNLPSSQDPMRRKVVGLLAYLTDQWTGFHRATLADMTAEAVYRLVEAGVVELAGNCYLMMPGSPLRMTAEVAVSGRYGDALPQLAIHVPEWFEGQQLRANPNGSFTPDAMRLTAGGVQVRAAVMNPAEQMGVLDQLCGMFIDDELLLAGMVSPGRVSLLGEVDVEGRQQPTVTVAAAAQATNNVVVNVPPIDIAAIVEQLRDAITSAAPPGRATSGSRPRQKR